MPQTAYWHRPVLLSVLPRAARTVSSRGYELIDQAAHGGDKKPLFTRLLTEQMLPSQLAAL